MIDRKRLLNDLKPLLRELEADLRARCDEVAEIGASLQLEYEQARSAGRTSAALEEWRADLITQVAVAWVLSTVFVRFLEDNALISPPRISGPLHGAGTDQGLMRARDEREQYFKSHPTGTERDYLLSVFDDLAQLPGTKDVFGAHNPVSDYRSWLSGDAAQKLIEFFQKIDADGTGEVIHDFTDPFQGSQGGGWDTRFLGDLYQDLSEAARKKYALLQTPIFVEEFILERTLEPAIKEFGLKDFKMIDPACGSGHFLLGGFTRLLKRWRQHEPATSDRELILRALSSVYGVDLNPFAIAIARFRLLIAVLRECRITKLKEAPGFQFNLACGDSLLHGERPVTGGIQASFDPEDATASHVYAAEDRNKLVAYLRHGQYHAVVANPPYITPKDPQQNANIRARYSSCHRQYALSVPFMERIFDLAVEGTQGNGSSAGFTGQITSNSFMKREFGKKLVESHIPRWDLTHVIDTQCVHIPEHGTGTAIILGRNRAPAGTKVRLLSTLKNEEPKPAVPERGKVWLAVVAQIDVAGSLSEFASTVDAERTSFHKHPWSIGGGGAAELKEQLDEAKERSLGTVTEAIGRTTVVGEDDVWIMDAAAGARLRIGERMVPLVLGECARDWRTINLPHVLYPYVRIGGEAIGRDEYAVRRYLAPFRTLLNARTVFGKTMSDNERGWWEHLEHYTDKLRTPLSIAFGFVATHNHFVLDRGGKVFNRSAPVIKLPADTTDDDHFAIISALNSSTACFWMKQMFFDKGGGGIGGGISAEPWERRFEFDGTKLQQFPLPPGRPLALTSQLVGLAEQLSSTLPAAVDARGVPTAEMLANARETAEAVQSQMIALQEELDWECYRLYGLIDDAPRCEGAPPIKLGQRAFEIVLARRMAAGERQTTWFTRHGSTPITQIPTDWPQAYREVVERRIEIIESDKNIALIERPEYKRRWNTEPWDEQQVRALNSWLLDRLESYFDIDGRMNERKTVTARNDLREPRLTSVAKIADLAKQDKDFMQVAELYAGRMDFDVATLVGELVAAESIPCLPTLRYKPSGLDKRTAWERTWELQREEDRLQAQIVRLEQELKHATDKKQPTVSVQSRITDCKSNMPDIPVPPKYTGADFKSGDFWRLRGKLDVPKERWVSFPYCEGEDTTLVIAWAGYDHLQLARAIAERYEHAKEHEGRKLVPLLACIGQLIPWLKQWHNELDPAFGTRMGDYFEGYLAEEAKALGQSVEQVIAWTPPAKMTKVKKAGRKAVPTGAGGFPDNDRDVLLIAAGLSLVGPNGISEDQHLDSLILMTTPERCRAMASDTSRFDSIVKGIDSEFWTDTGAKWKQTRDLLRQAKAIEVDVHSGQITRKEPVFTKLRNQFGKSLDELARVAIDAARSIQTATSTIQKEQDVARKRERAVA